MGLGKKQSWMLGVEALGLEVWGEMVWIDNERGRGGGGVIE